MAKEIEKKYALEINETRLMIVKRKATAEIQVAQGYIAIDEHTEVRVRRKEEKDKKISYVQTVKGGSGLVRDEVEFDLTAKQFDQLWPLTEGRRVEKTRYQIPLAGALIAEVDIYHGVLEGHATVEVECPDEETANSITLPKFLSGKDVTSDKKFKNQRLATEGWPQA